MTLQLIDWLIIAGYLVLALGIGLAMSRRAGKNMEEYFAAGRSLPWWLAGTSMVATTFAADTPLAVTGLTIKQGLAGNWVWWAMAVGGMVTVFVYARLWRRSGVLTDVELTELRYGGKPAAFLRGFRALYVSLLINAIIIGWVVGAMSTVLNETIFYGVEPDSWFDRNRDWLLIVGLLGVTGVYSVLSGLWGVTLTDFIQFIIAMIGCIALAFVAVNHIGGIGALQTRIDELDPSGNMLRFIPKFWGEGAMMPLDVFFILLFVMWWASWYPGAEPGGGGYVVQRMASCRSEKDSLLAALWFQVAHYCVRPWPWLIVALVAYVSYPQLHGADNANPGFPMIIRDTAPAGLVGLMLVTFFAAFMSTISTQVNWGASYLVNDFYKRFFAPNMADKALANASRLATLIVLCVGGLVAYLMRDMSVEAAWKFMLALGAGTGAVYMLRWFWWRINAWTEISAMASSLIYFVVLRTYFGGEGGLLALDERLLAVVAVLTICTWLIVTFLTQPESADLLVRFYRLARPSGPGWGPIAKLAPEVRSPDHLGRSLLCAILGMGVVFSVLPGVGSIIFGDYFKAAIAFSVTVVCVGVLLTQINAMTRD